MLKSILTGGWRYKTLSSKLNGCHIWTNGKEIIKIRYKNDQKYNSGYYVERERNGSSQEITNGLANTEVEAAVLADLYMRDDAENPSAFMVTDRVSINNHRDIVQQKEWLSNHTFEYEFEIVDLDRVDPQANHASNL